VLFKRSPGHRPIDLEVNTEDPDDYQLR